MRALGIINAGPESSLAWREIPTPQPGPGEVLIKVAAVGVANTDILSRRGFFGATPPIPGIDVAGTIAALGVGASGLNIGNRVVLNAAVTCDRCRYCNSGDHGTCRKRRALGQALDGGYSEFVCVPAANVLALADHVSFEQAAAIPSNFFTAWQMLFYRARVSPGDRVLISGAAGGVGSALAKIAVASGLWVVGAVGSDSKRNAVQEWGAHATVNYADEPMVEQVMTATDGAGVDAVFDTVGAQLWDQYLPVLAAGGRLVTCSAMNGTTPTIPLIELLSRQLTIMGTGGYGSKAIAKKVVDCINNGQFTPHVGAVLNIEQAEEAHQLFASRALIGKLVLQIAT